MEINEDLALSVIARNWRSDQTFREVLADDNPLTERGIIFKEWTPDQFRTLAIMIREAIDNACWQATQNS